MKKRARSMGKTRRNTSGSHPQNRRNRALVIAFSGVLGAALVVGIILFAVRGRSPAPTGLSSGYTISGTVTYSGSLPRGRVYMELFDSSGKDTGIGTSIASPKQPYSLPSVPSGSYRISAWMDNGNPPIGIPNAASPNGGAAVTVNNADASGQNIAVTDPSPVPTPVAPVSVRAGPGNGSVVVQWVAPRSDNGDVLAESYNVYYDTSSPVSPSTATKRTVQGNNHVFISGLDDGTTYYFVVTAVLGGIESSPSTPVVSATVGAPGGPNTVSGSISFPGKATGPLYAGVSGASGTFFQRIEKPVSPQSYSVSGVPSGTYVPFSLIDMNNDGVSDTGDLDKTTDALGAGSTAINVSGDKSGVNGVLSDKNVLARVISIHFSAPSANMTDIYSLEFEIEANVKTPVKVVLTSGPNVAVPASIGGNYYYRAVETLNSVKPKVGDSYTVAIDYSDGTSEKLHVPVTAVLDNVAQNLTAGGTDRTKPTFGWTAPSPPPPSYTYLIQVGQREVGQEWTYPRDGNGMASSQTAVVYNVDGTSSLTNLVAGTTYDWFLYIIDSNGNQAITEKTYTP